MREQLKKLGASLLTKINFKTTRVLNGNRISIPIINGKKVSVSGEKWMSGILRELFQFTDGTFYDVGINLGQTLIKVKTLDPRRNYVGFEPSPSCIFYLRRLINSNHWDQILIVPVGLWNVNGLV